MSNDQKKGSGDHYSGIEQLQGQAGSDAIDHKLGKSKGVSERERRLRTQPLG
jgi:hypothetical protein